MIEAKVRGYRGVERADIDVDGIALVGGINGAGKTSCAQGIASVLTGEAIPMRGINKSAAGVLVRASEAAGAATVQGPDGVARMDWPACTRRTDGTPPEASRYAVGLVSVADLPPAERVKVLSEMLRADPTRDDLRAAIIDHPELDPDQVTTVIWELVERDGWDAAVLRRRDMGAEMKGRWRQATGNNYGSRIAASYRQDLADEHRSESELSNAVAIAARTLETAIGAAATSGAEREKLQALASTVEDRTRALQEVEAECARAEGGLAQVVERRHALPPATDDRHVACPACGVLLVVRPGDHLLANPVLVEAKEPTSETELKARRIAIAEADGRVENGKSIVSAAQRARAEAATALQAARDAKHELDALPPPTEAAIDVDAARRELAEREEYLAGVRIKRKADEIAARIAANEIVIDILAPDGLRARKLARVVEAFNNACLKPLCEAAGWRPVEVSQDFELTYGGRHYGLLSASEQFRLRSILQVAIAQNDGSAMVIIDAADVLDGPGRSDLIQMLAGARIPAVVCMTLSKRDQVPDLAAARLGRSYWIEAGVATPIGTPRQASAQRAAA
jgi:hypothetical protein